MLEIRNQKCRLPTVSLHKEELLPLGSENYGPPWVVSIVTTGSIERVVHMQRALP